MHRWYEDLMSKVDGARCEKFIYAQLDAAAQSLGFEYCAFGLKIPYPLTRPRVVMINNYSQAWQNRYQSGNYLASDPTVAHGYRSNAPVLWTDDFFSKHQDLWEEAKSNGLCHGWSQSCMDTSGTASLLTLARSKDPISAVELKANVKRMQWLVSVAHLSLSNAYQSGAKEELKSSLTDREIEVLRWSADGKSAGEIAEILSLSKNTIDFHIKNAVSKLQTANKTAAVVRAIMLGLLF